MADISDVTNSFSYMAQIKDGQVTSSISKVDKNTGKIESDKVSDTAGGELDKEAFLQLLVAQMKYQDPLEPTDNTEYISQLANFSSLEQMQNMNESLKNMSTASDLQRASNLVGKFATVNSNGHEITGKVDAVEYKDGTAYLKIDDKSYPLSDLVESIDSTYLTAVTLSEQFNKILASIPDMEYFSDLDAGKVTNLRQAYEAMDMYQQTFISAEALGKLKAYEERLAEILAAQEAAKQEGSSEEANAETEEASKEATEVASTEAVKDAEE